MPANHAYSNAEAEQGLVIHVERRAHFRVEGAPRTGGPFHVAFRDGDDKLVDILTFESGRMSTSIAQPIVEGGTPPLSVSERATRIIFLDGDGDAIAQRPVKLVPGQVTPIRW